MAHPARGTAALPIDHFALLKAARAAPTKQSRDKDAGPERTGQGRSPLQAVEAAAELCRYPRHIAGPQMPARHTRSLRLAMYLIANLCDTCVALSRNPGSHNNDKETAALETGDLPAAVAALDQDVVFHSPVLATTGNEIRGLATVVKILQTAFTCVGMPRNVEEFQNSDGRYIVTFDGSIDGNLMQVAILVTENTDKKIESIRLFARPTSPATGPGP